MFALEVNFLTGRFVATAHDDRSAPEWPPHPARLYSALVAAHYAAPEQPPAERSALEWLERLEPPWIRCSDCAPREVVSVFVPVNDPTKEIGAKRVLPGILPKHADRKPRTFPSVTPEVPQVLYLWPEVEAPSATTRALDDICERAVRLGHSSSLVSVRVVQAPAQAAVAPKDAPEEARPAEGRDGVGSGEWTMRTEAKFPGDWMPVPDGPVRFRVVRAGQLRRLEDAYARHQEIEPRVMPASTREYARAGEPNPSEPSCPVWEGDWIVLRRTRGPVLPLTTGPALARQIRRVLIRYADEPVNEVISGHLADGAVSQRAHLAVVPLPFVGADHADGRILGVALVLPRSAAQEERTAAYRALAAWEDDVRGDAEEAPELPVHLGAAGVLGLVRLDGLAVETTLRPATWCGPARRWASATPIALDRNPGDLRSRDPGKLRAATADAEASIRLGCARIGLPEPLVVVSPSVPLAGSRKARLFAGRGAESADQIPRVLTHAVLVFDKPVRGPILVGAGRYHGLGLFRPVRDHDEADD